MKADDMVQSFRSLATEAIEAQGALSEMWRNLRVAEAAKRCDETDVELLKKLIKFRIYPVNAFELLARIDLEQAHQALLSRYVGEGVSPDGKFGGYFFELSTMIDDLKEIGGEQALRHLISLPGFDHKKLADPRVIASFADALEIQPNEFHQWLDSGASLSR
jgi:hypothetical protein